MMPFISSRRLVHRLVAERADLAERQVHDAYTLDSLGLDPLDVIIIADRLLSVECRGGGFPLDRLDRAYTVGDLVDVVESWRTQPSDAPHVEGKGS